MRSRFLLTVAIVVVAASYLLMLFMGWAAKDGVIYTKIVVTGNLHNEDKVVVSVASDRRGWNTQTQSATASDNEVEVGFPVPIIGTCYVSITVNGATKFSAAPRWTYFPYGVTWRFPVR